MHLQLAAPGADPTHRTTDAPEREERERENLLQERTGDRAKEEEWEEGEREEGSRSYRESVLESREREGRKERGRCTGMGARGRSWFSLRALTLSNRRSYSAAESLERPGNGNRFNVNEPQEWRSHLEIKSGPN